MVSKDEMQRLRSENELLQIQLKDITEIIALREEELDILRKKAAYNVMLQSTLEGNLQQITQLQNNVGEQERNSAGAKKREIAMEDELIQSLEMEKEFYNMRDKYESSKIAILDLDTELAETADMYRQLATSISRVAELESTLQITLSENEHLKEQLKKFDKRL